MPVDPTERRRALRRTPGVGDRFAKMKLRAGREMTVVDVSVAGVCLEGSTRLFPGTTVELQVPSRDGRTFMRARVLRSDVNLVAADQIRYRASLLFEARLEAGDGNFLPEAGT